MMIVVGNGKKLHFQGGGGGKYFGCQANLLAPKRRLLPKTGRFLRG